jgi:endonuclease/exonuclease/phosphatase family metal-dependent hydrolase
VTTVRVGTWNVHGLRAGVQAIADVVRREGIELLLVQESGSRRALRALGDALGMSKVSDPVVWPRRRVRNAVLARPGLGLRSQRFLRFEEGRWLVPRGAVLARFEGLTAVSVHLGLSRAERRSHAAQLLAALSDADGPSVIGGDLNALPDDPAATALSGRCPDVWPTAGEGAGLTMPAAHPTARIDYLFASPELRPVAARVSGGPGVSDHLLVVADLELPA